MNLNTARDQLRISLRNPHEESGVTAELGMADWAKHLPDDDVERLLDPSAGHRVQWRAGIGWRATDLD